MLHKIQKCKC